MQDEDDVVVWIGLDQNWQMVAVKYGGNIRREGTRPEGHENIGNIQVSRAKAPTGAGSDPTCFQDASGRTICVP
jgi:hypothetical protein